MSFNNEANEKKSKQNTIEKPWNQNGYWLAKPERSVKELDTKFTCARAPCTHQKNHTRHSILISKYTRINFRYWNEAQHKKIWAKPNCSHWFLPILRIASARENGNRAHSDYSHWRKKLRVKLKWIWKKNKNQMNEEANEKKNVAIRFQRSLFCSVFMALILVGFLNGSISNLMPMISQRFWNFIPIC